MIAQKNVNRFTLAMMVLTNIIPLVGVISGHWSGYDVVTLYIIETIIIGLSHAIRLYIFGAYFQKPPVKPRWMMLFLVLFFCFHFGMFVFVQSVLFFSFTASAGSQIHTGFNPLPNFAPFFNQPYVIAIYGFVFSQIMQSGKEFYKQFDYENLSLNQYMFLPYSRIFIQQFVVIFGGMFFIFSQSMTSVVALLVILKSVAEYLGLRYGMSWMNPQKLKQ